MPSNFKSVLIIEDDHDIRVTLRQVYESAGYYVFTVTNGQAAIDLLKIIPAPKLILSDLRMPIMDGASFIRYKMTENKIKNVPLIVMSAHQEKFCEFPEIICLPKPLDMLELIRHSEDVVKSENLIPKR